MESEDIPSRKVWLDYIGKLNDRALNRQRASGSTTWAVAGVVAILLIKALAHLPNITAGTNAASLHLTAVVGTFDLLFFAGMLFLLLLSLGESPAEARLKSRLERTSEPIVFGALCCLFVTSGSANLVTAILAPSPLDRWPFWVLGVFFALNAIGYPVSRIRSRLKHRKHIHDLPTLSTPPLIASSKHRIVFYSSAISMALAGLCLSALPSIQSIPHMKTTAHVDIITWALYVVAVFFLALFLCFRLASRRYDIFLGQLERRIILESLTPDAIRSEFIREFLGEDVRDWLSRAEANLKRQHDGFLQAATKAEEQFSELAKIDRGMQFEITGRKKAICEELKRTLEIYIKYSQKLQQQIEHLSDQRAPVACPDLFKQILGDWKTQLESIKTRHQVVCDACTKACDGETKAEPCAQVRPPAAGGRT